MSRRILFAVILGAVTLSAPPVVVGQEAARHTRTDQWLTQPVDDATFQTYLEFFTYNTSLSFNATTRDATTVDGVMREHVTYESTPSVRVTAYLYRPELSVEQTRGGIVYLHGGTGRGKEASDRPSRIFARDGWTVLAIDLLHYGERNTGLLTTYSNEEKSGRLYNEPATYLAFVEQTVKDVRRGFDYLVEKVGVDANRITLVGHSRGAVLGSIAGAAETRFAGVVMMHAGHFGLDVYSHRPAACPANYIGHISPRPLLMFQTDADTYFLPESTIRPLVALAREPVEVHWGTEGHGFMSDGDVANMLEWLRGVVP